MSFTTTTTQNTQYNLNSNFSFTHQENISRHTWVQYMPKEIIDYVREFEDVFFRDEYDNHQK